MSISVFCFSCRKELTFAESKIGLREECPHCRADVHVCKNCEFYEVSAYNECRESSADRVKEKERSNFCDYFSLKSGKGSSEDQTAKLRASAEALFKKRD